MSSSTRPVWPYIVGGCAAASLLGTAILCGTCALLASGPEGGIRYGNTMEPYATQYLAEHAVLEPGESVVAFYDASVSLDASEFVVVTTRRLVYGANGTTSAVLLADIVDVSQRDGAFGGTLVDVATRDGQLLLSSSRRSTTRQAF